MKTRRVLIGAAAAGAISLATATAAVATANVEASRLAGGDRYQTSRAIAEESFGGGTTVAIVASGEDFPDALAASYLAGASDAPVVLTQAGQLSDAALGALQDTGVSGVLLVGGTAAVDEAVEAQLEGAGLTVDRIAGTTRYETARAIAEAVPEEQIGSLDADVGRTALLASGERFPDALTGGPLAYQSAFPMLLTSQSVLSEHAEGAIEGLGIEQVVILGGTSAISAEVEAAVEAMGVDVRRVAGADRTFTATQIAELGVDELGYSTSHVNLARGDDFPDALSGSGDAGTEKALVLLTQNPDSLGPAAAVWLQSKSGTLTTIDVYGGPAAVSDSTVNAAEISAGRTP